MISALLFSWLQGADFYRELHQIAVDKIPVGNGRLWIDIGCGPGLLSRQAAQKNYRVLGIDADPWMIRFARTQAQRNQLDVRYEIGTLDNLAGKKADVVSAASLLAVLPDKETGLRLLWQAVQAGGYLLVIEPTEKMNPENAEMLIQSGLPGGRKSGLRLWSRARSGRAVDEKIFYSIESEDIQCYTVLQDLVKAWIMKKKEN